MITYFNSTLLNIFLYVHVETIWYNITYCQFCLSGNIRCFATIYITSIAPPFSINLTEVSRKATSRACDLI